MFPKKLFGARCLYPDREFVFKQDLEDFFLYILKVLKVKIKDEEELLIEQFNIHNFSFKNFKVYWKEKKMSMLHFSKSKEENTKEYYEVLFGEVQSIITFISNYIN